MNKKYYFFRYRRFGHALAVALKVPHLYFGDRDGGGLRHYLTLKFGCNTRVWTTEQLAIPEMQFLGLTEEDLDLVPDEKMDRLDSINADLIQSLLNRPFFDDNQNEFISRVNLFSKPTTQIITKM